MEIKNEKGIVKIIKSVSGGENVIELVRYGYFLNTLGVIAHLWSGNSPQI